jgi:hypothetical protein
MSRKSGNNDPNRVGDSGYRDSDSEHHDDDSEHRDNDFEHHDDDSEYLDSDSEHHDNDSEHRNDDSTNRYTGSIYRDRSPTYLDRDSTYRDGGPIYRHWASTYHDRSPIPRERGSPYRDRGSIHHDRDSESHDDGSKYQQHQRRRTSSRDEDRVEDVPDQRDNTHRSPRLEFDRAVGYHGNAITIEVPLQNTGGLIGFLSTKQIPRQATAKWLEIDGELGGAIREKIEWIDVLSSHKYSTNEEEYAVLRYKKSSRGSSDCQFRWMYGSTLLVDYLPLLIMSAVTCNARLTICKISRQVPKGFPVEPTG